MYSARPSVRLVLVFIHNHWIEYWRWWSPHSIMALWILKIAQMAVLSLILSTLVKSKEKKRKLNAMMPCNECINEIFRPNEFKWKKKWNEKYSTKWNQIECIASADNVTHNQLHSDFILLYAEKKSNSYSLESKIKKQNRKQKQKHWAKLSVCGQV